MWNSWLKVILVALSGAGVGGAGGAIATGGDPTTTIAAAAAALVAALGGLFVKTPKPQTLLPTAAPKRRR